MRRAMVVSTDIASTATGDTIGTTGTGGTTGINFLKGQFLPLFFYFLSPSLILPLCSAEGGNLPHLNPPPPLEGEDTGGDRNFLKRKLFYGKIKH